jgi:hypothetical protein
VVWGRIDGVGKSAELTGGDEALSGGKEIGVFDDRGKEIGRPGDDGGGEEVGLSDDGGGEEVGKTGGKEIGMLGIRGKEEIGESDDNGGDEEAGVFED